MPSVLLALQQRAKGSTAARKLDVLDVVAVETEKIKGLHGGFADGELSAAAAKRILQLAESDRPIPCNTTASPSRMVAPTLSCFAACSLRGTRFVQSCPPWFGMALKNSTADECQTKVRGEEPRSIKVRS